MKDQNKKNAEYWTHERLAEIEVSWSERPSVDQQETVIRSLVAAIRFARQERDSEMEMVRHLNVRISALQDIDRKYQAVGHQRDIERERADNNSTVATAARLMLTRLDNNGFWEDGCFYYCRHAAPELQEPIEALTKALDITAKKLSKKLHVFKGTSQRAGSGLCTICGNFAAHKLHVIPQEGNEI